MKKARSNSNLKTTLARQVSENCALVTGGRMLCIDPSVGSSSSMPGYAVYIEGQLAEAGIIEVGPRWPLPQRLQEIARSLREDFDDIDVVLVEGVPSRARKGNFRMSVAAHSSLLQAVGACLAAIPAVPIISVDARLWRRWAGESYVKGDIEDAIAIGAYVLSLASELSPSNGGKNG